MAHARQGTSPLVDTRGAGPQPGQEDRSRPGQGRARRHRRRGGPRRRTARTAQPRSRQAAYLTNQVVNALAAPVEAAWRELDEADTVAAAIPARVALGTLAPDMVRLDTETKQITHAIRMAAYNAETTLARTLNGHYARPGPRA